MLAEILVDIPLPKIPGKAWAWWAGALRRRLEELELNSLQRQSEKFAELFSAAGQLSLDTGNAADSPRSSAPEPDTHHPAAEAGADHQHRSADPGEPAAATQRRCPRRGHRHRDHRPQPVPRAAGGQACWGEADNDLAYIPVGHTGAEGQLPLAEVLEALATWLAGNASACKTLNTTA